MGGKPSIRRRFAAVSGQQRFTAFQEFSQILPDRLKIPTKGRGLSKILKIRYNTGIFIDCPHQTGQGLKRREGAEVEARTSTRRPRRRP